MERIEANLGLFMDRVEALGGSMERIEANLGLFMDRVEAGVALVGGSRLRVLLGSSEARAGPRRDGDRRRVSFVQDDFCVDVVARRCVYVTGPGLGGSMERIEANLGLFMDRGVAGVALVGGSGLRVSEDTSEA